MPHSILLQHTAVLWQQQELARSLAYV
jgi:hypothetical protein